MITYYDYGDTISSDSVTFISKVSERYSVVMTQVGSGEAELVPYQVPAEVIDAEHNAAIQDQISACEQKQHRPMRENLIDPYNENHDANKLRISEVDAEILALRAQLR